MKELEKINKLSCANCKFFDSLELECNNDNWYKTHCRFEECTPCEFFEAIKECEHKFENCDINGCSILCHSTPSERGCKFYYQCKLDDFPCDEKCEKHKDRHNLEALRKEKGDLIRAKESIEKSVKRYDKKINELEEKIKKGMENG